MANKDPFSGDGYDRDPLGPEDNASMRQMREKVSDAWPAISAINDMRKGGQNLIKLATGVAVIGGVIAYLAKQGFFS